MLSKYKKIYQTSIEETALQTCKKWKGFNYKGGRTFTINYTLCGDTVPSVYTFEDLPGNGGDIAYYTCLTDFDEYPCVVAPVPNIFSAVYGEDCS